ncbi:MAG: hypothetical protein QOE58_3241 [Actinomycetota bacterium]|jgi:hypothetical protein|nr:hypothetical protein [Actinomycetota bacterium]
MTMPEPTPTALVLSWQPEVEDYVEAFRAMNRIRRVPEFFGVMVVAGAILGIAGFWANQSTMVGVGIALVITPAYVAGPGNYLSVRSIWRRSPMVRLPVEVRVDPDGGLTSTIPGSTGQSTGRTGKASWRRSGPSSSARRAARAHHS